MAGMYFVYDNLRICCRGGVLTRSVRTLFADLTQINPEDMMLQVEPGRFEYLSDLSLVGLQTA